MCEKTNYTIYKTKERGNTSVTSLKLPIHIETKHRQLYDDKTTVNGNRFKSTGGAFYVKVSSMPPNGVQGIHLLLSLDSSWSTAASLWLDHKS